MFIKLELYNEDCLKRLEKIGEKTIDFILTDIPYGITACSWDIKIEYKQMWERLYRVLKNNSLIALFSCPPMSSELIMSNYKNFKYEWVWVKPQGVDPFIAWVRPLRNTEYILIFGKGGTFNYYPQLEKGSAYVAVRDKSKRRDTHYTTCFRYSVTENEGWRLPTRTLYFPQERGFHPTQKPVPLLEYLIKTYTKRGQTVLDFTAGSFSTAIACIKTSRNFIGIEKKKEYYEIGRERIKKFLLEKNLKQ